MGDESTVVMELTKEEVVNLISSVQPSSYKDCEELVETGLMYFSGNQHNPDWSWSYSKLYELPLQSLVEIYTLAKRIQ